LGNAISQIVHFISTSHMVCNKIAQTEYVLTEQYFNQTTE